MHTEMRAAMSLPTVDATVLAKSSLMRQSLRAGLVFDIIVIIIISLSSRDDQ